MMRRVIELRDDVAVPDGFPGAVEDGRQVFTIVESTPGFAPRPVGAVVARVDRAAVRVSRVWTTSDAGPLEDDLVVALRQHFVAGGATVVNVDVAAAQVALTRAVQGATVLGVFMTKPVASPPPALPPGFGGRPMTDDEFTAWSTAQIAHYVQDLLDRSGGDHELAERDARASYADLLPAGSGTADTALLVLTHDGDPVGFLWLRHHWSTGEPGAARDLSFVFDVEIDAAYRGRGFGRAAMALGEQLALGAGDAQYGLHVFGFNDVALGLYESYGFVARSRSFDLASLG